MLQYLLLLFFSAFCTDYHLQFEEVGSLTAGEAMEEQADTERTETVRGESSAGTTLGDISLLDRSMYYWAPTVQAPIEQHIDFDVSQPPIFSPPEASHVSVIFCYFIYTTKY